MNQPRLVSRLLIPILLAGGAIVLLLLFVPGGMPAVHSDSTGVDPMFRAITVTARVNLWISDTAPYHGIGKTVYFNNTQAGTLTVTHEISGTPTLTLTAPAVFGVSQTVVTSTEAPTRFVVVYPVPTGVVDALTPVRYTAENAGGIETAVTITFARDVNAPDVIINPPAPVITLAEGTPLMITGTASDNGAGVESVWVNAGSGWSAAAGTTSWFYQWTVPSADYMTYTLQVTTTDRVGNVSTLESLPLVVDNVYGIYLPVVLRNYALLSNGDFSQGWAGWTHGGELERSLVTDQGKGQTALLGSSSYNNNGGVPVGKAWMHQTFTVPKDGVVLLKVWYHLRTYDVAWVEKTNTFFDTWEISINKTPDQITQEDRNVVCRAPQLNQDPGAGNPVGSGLVFCAGGPETVSMDGRLWEDSKTITLDLSNFKGQTITIYFANYNREDRWYNTYTYVDDIRLEQP